MSRRAGRLRLDNEAVQALADPAHAKHSRVLAFLEAAIADTSRRGATRIPAAVPTAVRVEAGVDRTSATGSVLSRLRIADLPLDRRMADTAAAIEATHAVGPADAHLAAEVRHHRRGVAVLTSDPDDIRRAAAPATSRTIRV